MRTISRWGKISWLAGLAVLVLLSACAQTQATAVNEGKAAGLLSSCELSQTSEALPLVPIPGYEIGQPLTISLAVRDAAFDQKLIEVPAGIRLTIVFTNDDDVPHNFGLYRTSAAKEAIFVSDTIGAHNTATFNFVTPDTASRLFFRSDTYPEMSGTLRVLG